jgi:xylose isomerase
MKMANDFKHSIGFKGTLLLEPKPQEPTKHQYDWDAATTIAFLHKYGLLEDFKLNIECNHATLSGRGWCLLLLWCISQTYVCAEVGACDLCMLRLPPATLYVV